MSINRSTYKSGKGELNLNRSVYGTAAGDVFRRYSTSSGDVGAYASVLNAFTTKPSDGVMTAQAVMVEALEASGVWDKLDRFFVFAAHTNGDGEALVDWKNPGGTPALGINAPSFVGLEGFTSDGSTSYINSQFIPSDGVNHQGLDGSAFVYSRTNSKLLNGFMLGGVPFNRGVTIWMYGTLGRTYYACNSEHKYVAGQDYDGLLISGRLGGNVYFHRNSVEQSTFVPTYTFADAFTEPLPILAGISGGVVSNFTDNQASIVGFSAFLDSSDRSSLQSAIEAYMDSNGKGVIA